MNEKIPDHCPEKQHRYAVYSRQAATADGLAYTRPFIVVKNGYGVIVRFTRLHKYAGIYKHSAFLPLTSNPEAKLYYICAMLNYALADNGGRFKIQHVFGITKGILQEFCSSFALEKKPDGTYRGKASIESCVSAVCSFMASLAREFGGYMNVSEAELYTQQVFYSKKGRPIKKAVPLLQARGISQIETLLRDIPTKVFEILLSQAFLYARDIAFGICLQAFAGLRAGEVCNVRQECSPLGAGIRFTEIEGRIVKAEIDLSRELLLRSDHVAIGRIKKERLQCVYPAFMTAFYSAYKIHKEFMANARFEPEYAPMFVNRRGKAMTYDDYSGRFHRLVETHLRPELMKSSDPELRIYGQLLYENRLSPHALRHWYTVQLVLRGEDIANIQFWRGDTSPQSAFEYLQNKGDLNRELVQANDRLAELMMEIGGHGYER